MRSKSEERRKRLRLPDDEALILEDVDRRCGRLTPHEIGNVDYIASFLCISARKEPAVWKSPLENICNINN